MFTAGNLGECDAADKVAGWDALLRSVAMKTKRLLIIAEATLCGSVQIPVYPGYQAHLTSFYKWSPDRPVSSGQPYTAI